MYRPVSTRNRPSAISQNQPAKALTPRQGAKKSGPGYVGLENLISHQMPLSQGQEAFELVQQGKASKVVLFKD